MQSGMIAPPWLQEAWIRRLQWHHEYYDWAYVGGKLRLPVMLIDGAGERLGRWDGLHRTMSFSEAHILEDPWESVLETLRHEMAHQYVDEVLGLPGSPPHGEPFLRACRVLRVEPRAAARPEAAARSPEREAMLGRIRELLAMAGSPNEHEAATAMRLANKYLLKYNIDLAEAAGSRPAYGVRHLGRSSARIQEWEYTLAHILQEHFFVKVVWVFSYDPLRNQPGRILQVAGTPENMEMAEYVHRYITGIAEPLWESHRKGGGGGTRLQYLAGLLEGFDEKLESQKVQLRQERGLVWKGDPLLQEFFRHVHPRLRSLGSSGVRRGEGFDAGRRDGKEITIRRGVGGGAVQRGRLLPGGGP